MAVGRASFEYICLYYHKITESHRESQGDEEPTAIQRSSMAIAAAFLLPSSSQLSLANPLHFHVPSAAASPLLHPIRLSLPHNLTPIYTRSVDRGVRTLLMPFASGDDGGYIGGNGNDGHSSGGRGGGGDHDGGAGSAGDNNKKEALMVLAEADRLLESLPKDLAAAIAAGRIPGSVVSRFLELEKSSFLRWLMEFGGFRERLLADDLFLAKVGMECGVGIFTKVGELFPPFPFFLWNLVEQKTFIGFPEV